MAGKSGFHGYKDKQKALKAVSTLHGIDSLAVDMKDGKMTVTGLVDVVTKLRRNNWPSAQIVSIGPWPEKKKDDAPKLAWYDAQQPQLYYPQHVIHSAEEDPNSCVIC